MKKITLGVDTSNYTTSLSLICNGIAVANVRRLLPVAENERGLRQSDALFYHTKALPELCEELFSSSEYDKSCLAAVGVSSRPRNIEGSYMPCFLAGISFAKAVSCALDIPVYEFSHQEGHIEAAASSSGHPDIFSAEFISFHVSGGTTEIIHCVRNNDETISCKQIGGTLDLNAGQAVDRIGVMLGFRFPCGKALDELSHSSSADFGKIKVSVKGTDCSLSGLENKAKNMISDGYPKEDIALFLFLYLGEVLERLTCNVRKMYPSLPILYAGGVMSNSIIRQNLSKNENVYFASGELSSDNAVGTGLLAYNKSLTEIL